MFKRLLISVVSLLLVAGSATAANISGVALPNSSGFRWAITSTITTNDFLVAPARSFQRLAFTRGSAFTATIYACEEKTYAAGTCTSVGALSATADNVDITTGKPWLVIDVTAAETGSNVSYITIQSNPQNAGAGGGGAHQAVYYADAYGGGLDGINDALDACDAYAEENDKTGIVYLPRGEVAITGSASFTSPLITLPTYTSAAGQQDASCELRGWGSVKDWSGLAGNDPIGSAILVYNGDNIVDTDSRNVVIHATGHGQKMSGFNIVLGGAASTDTDQTTAILIASADNDGGGADVIGDDGVKEWHLDDVNLISGYAGSGTLVEMIFALNGRITNSGFGYGATGLLLTELTNTASNANFVAGNRFYGNTVAIDIPAAWSCQDFYLNGGNTIEGNAYGIRLRSGSTCRVSSYGTHWEQDKDLSVVGLYDVLIEDNTPVFQSFGDFFDSDLTTPGNMITRTVSQEAGTNWDAVYSGNFRSDQITPFNYAAGAGIFINGRPPIITTTGGTPTAGVVKMRGEIHIADHTTATSDVDYTLPDASYGMSSCFYDNGGGSGGIIIDAAAGDEILLYGNGVGTADAIDSPGVAGAGANGDFICLQAISETYWITLGGSGTWVDGGVD